MRRVAPLPPLLGLCLLAGCALRPAPFETPLSPGRALEMQVAAVTPSRLVPPAVALREAASMAAEGRRALVDVTVARDPILAAPGARRRVQDARAALERLPSPALEPAARQFAAYREFLAHTGGLLAATAAMDEAALARAAAQLRGHDAGALAGARAQEAVAGALAALRQRYLAPWPGRNAVYLTVEGGPDPATTPHLLAQLAQTGARATLFVTAERAAAHPDLVRAAATAGHPVGLLIPPPAGPLPAPAFRAQVDQAAQAVRSAAGVGPRLVRLAPGWPWERAHLHVLEAAGLVVMQGTVEVRPEQPGSTALVAGAARGWNGQAPAVVTLHETGALAQTAGGVAGLLAFFKGRGYLPGRLPAGGPGLWLPAARLLGP